MLEKDADTVLIDVRSEKELSNIGYPDLEGLGKNVVFIEWTQTFFKNSKRIFLDKFTEHFSDENKNSYIFICRSGIRSNLAALAVEESVKSGNDGTMFFNVIDGFEGNSNIPNLPVRENGWKVSGKPWKYLDLVK
jgi:rhodanese-related sulfurtransferase